jgi:hypothetical protein
MGFCLASLCPSVELTEDPATRKVTVSLVQHKNPTAKVPDLKKTEGRTLNGPAPGITRPKTGMNTPARMSNRSDMECRPKVTVTEVDNNGEAVNERLNPRKAAARAAEVR